MNPDPPPEKSQKYRVSKQFCPDPLKNYEATKPTFYVGPSSACQRNAILKVFYLRADDRPLIVVFGSSHPSSTKK